jgi:C4-dicarboxylate-specific signal transduction histidine kinase
VLSLPDILSNTLILYREKLRANSIGLEIASVPDHPAIHGNPTQLEQVFINLMQNAIDALDGVSKPQITILFGLQGDEALITFTDNGPGLDSEIATKIFEPFFTTKPIGKGTGLGLSIVYGIITDHNGTIDCQSHPGQGCRFVITLPAVT